MEIQIGQKFTPIGKVARPSVVTDIYKTYNSKGELVKTTYVSQHDFMGQTVTNYDVPSATIMRSLLTTSKVN